MKTEQNSQVIKFTDDEKAQLKLWSTATPAQWLAYDADSVDARRAYSRFLLKYRTVLLLARFAVNGSIL